MKFIKTAYGRYIDRDKIDSFAVCEHFKYPDGDNAGFAVCAFIHGDRWSLKEFACDPNPTTKSGTKEAAQVWLDDFVAKLNEEN